jgi:diguanylate cyclase (GGDEF)-like protein
LFGLAGSARIIRDAGGHGALTLHLPFIIAAMALGGPVAGGWVAMLATFDRRELTEVPWYGVLANHASLTLAAIAGGIVVLGTRAAFEAVGMVAGPDTTFIAIIAGTLMLTFVSTVLAAGVIVLRDGLTIRETAIVFNRSFRATAAAETVLGWLLVVAWTAVGWWAPAVCTILVLALWRTTRAEGLLDRDELTGVLSRQAFASRTAEAADRARRGIEGSAYLFLDLDGFKAVNDRARDHGAGDRVLAEVGRRLRGSIRVTDAAGRRGGDEFMVLFTGVRDEAEALRLGGRVHAAVTAPYALAEGEWRLGVSIGVVLIAPGREDSEPGIRQRADAAMYEAKAAGGGVRIARDAAAG